MKKLTIKKLQAMKPNSIFATGSTLIEHPWEFAKSVAVKWVAVRGNIADWAIYHSFDGNIINMYGQDHFMARDTEIAMSGTKIHNIDKIVELVPCTTEALLAYRH